MGAPNCTEHQGLRKCKPDAEGVSGMYDRDLPHLSLEALAVAVVASRTEEKAAMCWLRKGNLQKVENILAIPVTLKAETKTAIITEWQREWNQTTKAMSHHNFLPNVQQRIENKVLTPSQGLIHFLIQHKFIGRTFREDDRCNYGTIGTQKHMLKARARSWKYFVLRQWSNCFKIICYYLL